MSRFPFHLKVNTQVKKKFQVHPSHKNVWTSDKSWEPEKTTCSLDRLYPLIFCYSGHAEQLLFSCLCSKVIATAESCNGRYTQAVKISASCVFRKWTLGPRFFGVKNKLWPFNAKYNPSWNQAVEIINTYDFILYLNFDPLKLYHYQVI